MGGTRTETLGEDRPVRRWAVLGRVAIPLLVGAGLVATSWVQRAGDETRDALERVFSQSVLEDRAAQGRIEVALAYVTPALWRPDLPPETEDSLWRVVGEQARAGADGMAGLHATLDGITVLPWQAGHRQARDALSALVTAQEDRYRSMAEDARRVPAYLARGPVPDDAAARALRSIGAAIR